MESTENNVVPGHTTIVSSSAGGLLSQAVSHMFGSTKVKTVERRGGAVREFLGPVTLVLTQPQHRLAAIPGRNLNPWVSLAEFPWIMAGRNDIAWLQPYLPRARDFSDDGARWRAGYGNRMRDWGSQGTPSVPFGVDQVAEVVRRLEQDPWSRQAVISLWDPVSDNVSGSRDYPCTNHLHFMKNSGSGALDLYVVMRSNDLWWGFSGVNVVNFTLLQEVVARCLGMRLGEYYHTANNLHLYSHHWDAALSLQRGQDPYDTATPTAIRTVVEDSGAVSRLDSFTAGCRDALGMVESEREKPVRDIDIGGAGGTDLCWWPWLQKWVTFMLLHNDARAPLEHVPPDWRRAAELWIRGKWGRS